MKYTIREITETDRRALRKFARAHGRYWKMALRRLWVADVDPSVDPALYHIRDEFGYKWLTRYRINDPPQIMSEGRA